MPDQESDAPLTHDERIWVLLDRYLAGDARGSDEALVRDWVSADPRREEVLDDLRRIRAAAGAGCPRRSSDEAWQSLRWHLGVETGNGGTGALAEREHISGTHLRPTSDVTRFGLPKRFATYAAASVLLLAAGWSAVAIERAVTARWGSARSSAGAPRSFATERGRRAEVRLADGTRVSLAPESRVTIANEGDGVDRDVVLEGEAYFDVAHDGQRPFEVRARNVVIHDVGTRFAVRAYRTDSVVQVVVTNGRVRMRSSQAVQGSGVTLEQGMMGLLDASGVTSLRRGVDTARYNAFARGQMQFVRTPLRDVVGELERWYDIDIRLEDRALGSRRITATLEDQALPDFLAQLSITLNLRVTSTGRLVVLHSS